MIESDHLRLYVVRPVLKEMGLYASAAENLLLGTAAQESHMGTYLRQLNEGPAMGIYQMEPATYADIWNSYLAYRIGLGANVRSFARPRPAGHPKPEEMIGNLYFATAMARVHYYRQPEALPAADDVEGLGRYWKKYYNTPRGHGTVAQFVHNYERFVGEG